MSEELEWELYDIFESGLFAFPIWDHSSARKIVVYLLGRGVLSEEIADAIEDTTYDLEIWLNRGGKHMVGEWIIAWINECREEYDAEKLQEQMEEAYYQRTPDSSDESDTEDDYGSDSEVRQMTEVEEADYDESHMSGVKSICDRNKEGDQGEEMAEGAVYLPPAPVKASLRVKRRQSLANDTAKDTDHNIDDMDHDIGNTDHDIDHDTGDTRTNGLRRDSNTRDIDDQDIGDTDVGSDNDSGTEDEDNRNNHPPKNALHGVVSYSEEFKSETIQKIRKIGKIGDERTNETGKRATKTAERATKTAERATKTATKTAENAKETGKTTGEITEKGKRTASEKSSLTVTYTGATSSKFKTLIPNLRGFELGFSDIDGYNRTIKWRGDKIAKLDTFNIGSTTKSASSEDTNSSNRGTINIASSTAESTSGGTTNSSLGTTNSSTTNSETKNSITTTILTTNSAPTTNTEDTINSQNVKASTINRGPNNSPNTCTTIHKGTINSPTRTSNGTTKTTPTSKTFNSTITTTNSPSYSTSNATINSGKNGTIKTKIGLTNNTINGTSINTLNGILKNGINGFTKNAISGTTITKNGIIKNGITANITNAFNGAAKHLKPKLIPIQCSVVPPPGSPGFISHFEKTGLPICPNCTCKLAHLSVDNNDNNCIDLYLTHSPAMEININTLDKDGPGFIFILTDCLTECLPWNTDSRYKVTSSRQPEKCIQKFSKQNIDIEIIWQIKVQHHILAVKEVHTYLQTFNLNTNWYKCPLKVIVETVSKVAKRFREE